MEPLKPQDKTTTNGGNAEAEAAQVEQERLLSTRFTTDPSVANEEKVNHDAIARQQMTSMNELIKRMKKP